MSRALSNRISRLALWAVLALMLLPALAAAQNMAADLAKAQELQNQGKLEEAWALVCRYEGQDTGARATCNSLTKERDRNKQRYEDGKALLAEKKWDEAKAKLRQVRMGPVDAAQLLLAQIDQQQRDEEGKVKSAAIEAKWNEGMSALNAGNLDQAAQIFNGLKGPDQKPQEATRELNRIATYKSAMQDATRLEGSNDLAGALRKYQDAAQIYPNGPGGPTGRVGEITAKLKALEVPNEGPKVAEARAAFNRNDFDGAKGILASLKGPDAAALKNEIATYERILNEARGFENREKPDLALAKYQELSRLKRGGPGDVDAKIRELNAKLIADLVPKYLQQAKDAESKNNLKLAKSFYLKAVNLDDNNQEARDGLKRINAASPQQAETAGGDTGDVTILTKALNEFYRGEYERAEGHIQDHLDLAATKKGLSFFYLGVSKLTRYFLAGAPDNDKKLFNDAMSAFSKAKKAPGFKPPSDKFISPKILKAFEQAT